MCNYKKLYNRFHDGEAVWTSYVGGTGCSAFAVAIAVSYIIYGMRKPIDNFGTAFCNAGFIGIPLVTAVFGNEAAFYVASFASILNLLQWTYGIVIITRRKDMINIKRYSSIL